MTIKKTFSEFLEICESNGMIDYVRLDDGAKSANDKSSAHKLEKQKKREYNLNMARELFRTKGIPFSDKQGSGYIVNGKKVYGS